MATHVPADIEAEDGLPREPSNDPSVHRALVVVDPPMRGKDVAELQRATRDRLKARGLADDIPVPTHGKFTLATALACLEAQYFLGLRPETYLKQDKHGPRVVTEGAQRIIREPDTRDADQLQRAENRRGGLAEGPRYRDDLAKELGIAGGKGPADALKFAIAQIGVKEQPANSNWGPKIQDWIRATGYNGPVPWCGCFVNDCIMAGGLPSGAGWIGYTPSILARSRAGKDGWSFHAKGQPGDPPCSTRPAATRRSTSRSSVSASRTPATARSAATRRRATRVARPTAARSPPATTARPWATSGSSGSPDRPGSERRRPRARRRLDAAPGPLAGVSRQRRPGRLADGVLDAAREVVDRVGEVVDGVERAVFAPAGDVGDALAIDPAGSGRPSDPFAARRPR
jgi:hypothetical protein